ncbi:Thioredoxin reductase [Minicystis rosea]|nr:Thioredoxin reductase [Minicystis rosea]
MLHAAPCEQRTSIDRPRHGTTDALAAGMTPSERDAIESAARALLHGRFEQAFPALSDAEIARIRRFGSVQRFADGEPLFEAGKPRLGMHILLSGHVAITARDGLGRVTPVVDQGPGQFLAELATLADNATSLVDGHADGDVEALILRPEQLRALIVDEAELGERIMRALVLRRIALLELGEGGPLVIGAAASRDVVRLENFLRRNGQPHRFLDPAVDSRAAGVVMHLSPASSELPLVICPSGSVLRNPNEPALAHALGLLGDRLVRSTYDVAIVGCGPAGLATAVYAASEGLSVVVLDARAFGGQAGASARIENYLGFPTGISGMALAARAFAQARKFGAEIIIPVEVKALDCRREGGCFGLDLDDGRRLRARTVVIASGACYRRPAIENLADFEGRGIWYWASPIEAKLCAGREVIVVGGGNSAGQAAVFLSAHTAKVRMMIRGPEVAASMSRYLIERITATDNIELMTETEIVALEGSAELGLERVRWRSRRDAAETSAPITNVFLFIGADPATSWLAGCGVALDPHGFVVTGTGASPLASSVPGVFAVGDVRLGSVKRVGGAIGEGAQIVPAIHAFLGTAAHA